MSCPAPPLTLGTRCMQIDGLFLVMITNKASNIVEDLDCLRLLSKVSARQREPQNRCARARVSGLSIPPGGGVPCCLGQPPSLPLFFSTSGCLFFLPSRCLFVPFPFVPPRQVVPEFAGAVDEESVSAAAFELIFAFDEVISMGLKENITVQQARSSDRGQGEWGEKTGLRPVRGRWGFALRWRSPSLDPLFEDANP